MHKNVGHFDDQLKGINFRPETYVTFTPFGRALLIIYALPKGVNLANGIIKLYARNGHKFYAFIFQFCAVRAPFHLTAALEMVYDPGARSPRRTTFS